MLPVQVVLILRALRLLLEQVASADDLPSHFLYDVIVHRGVPPLL